MATSKQDERDMAVWADNIKFVREIIESKFSKIDHSVAEVRWREDGRTMLIFVFRSMRDWKCWKMTRVPTMARNTSPLH